MPLQEEAGGPATTTNPSADASLPGASIRRRDDTELLRLCFEIDRRTNNIGQNTSFQQYMDYWRSRPDYETQMNQMCSTRGQEHLARYFPGQAGADRINRAIAEYRGTPTATPGNPGGPASGGPAPAPSPAPSVRPVINPDPATWPTNLTPQQVADHVAGIRPPLTEEQRLQRVNAYYNVRRNNLGTEDPTIAGLVRDWNTEIAQIDDLRAGRPGPNGWPPVTGAPTTSATPGSTEERWEGGRLITVVTAPTPACPAGTIPVVAPTPPTEAAIGAEMRVIVARRNAESQEAYNAWRRADEEIRAQYTYTILGVPTFNEEAYQADPPRRPPPSVQTLTVSPTGTIQIAPTPPTEAAIGAEMRMIIERRNAESQEAYNAWRRHDDPIRAQYTVEVLGTSVFNEEAYMADPRRRPPPSGQLIMVNQNGELYNALDPNNMNPFSTPVGDSALQDQIRAQAVANLTPSSDAATAAAQERFNAAAAPHLAAASRISDQSEGAERVALARIAQEQEQARALVTGGIQTGQAGPTTQPTVQPATPEQVQAAQQAAREADRALQRRFLQPVSFSPDTPFTPEQQAAIRQLPIGNRRIIADMEAMVRGGADPNQVIQQVTNSPEMRRTQEALDRLTDPSRSREEFNRRMQQAGADVIAQRAVLHEFATNGSGIVSGNRVRTEAEREAVMRHQMSYLQVELACRLEATPAYQSGRR